MGKIQQILIRLTTASSSSSSQEGHGIIMDSSALTSLPQDALHNFQQALLHKEKQQLEPTDAEEMAK
jgi:hypothetical protein